MRIPRLRSSPEAGSASNTPNRNTRPAKSPDMAHFPPFTISPNANLDKVETLYAKWMLDWENRLCSRATNRVVRPFDWGLDWTHGWPLTEKLPRNGHDPEAYLRDLNRAALE